jgi:hypothetical protein
VLNDAIRYNDAADDEKVHNANDRFMNRAVALAKEMGLDHRYIYQNYAIQSEFYHAFNPVRSDYKNQRIQQCMAVTPANGAESEGHGMATIFLRRIIIGFLIPFRYTHREGLITALFYITNIDPSLSTLLLFASGYCSPLHPI